jgi:hypothetical protein
LVWRCSRAQAQGVEVALGLLALLGLLGLLVQMVQARMK